MHSHFICQMIERCRVLLCSCSVVRGRTRSVLSLRTCVNCLLKVTAEMPMTCAVMHTTERVTPLEVRADTSGTPVQFVSLNAGATPAVAIARPLPRAFSLVYFTRDLCLRLLPVLLHRAAPSGGHHLLDVGSDPTHQAL